jgi:hypothetical protein
MRAMWALVVFLPLFSGAVVTLGAGGATLWKRLMGAIGCATAVGVFYTVLTPLFGHGQAIEISKMVINCVWRVFVFTILSAIGVLMTELKLPEPNPK